MKKKVIEDILQWFSKDYDTTANAVHIDNNIWITRPYKLQGKHRSLFNNITLTIEV